MSSASGDGETARRRDGKWAGDAPVLRSSRNSRLLTADSRLRLGGVLQQAILILASLVALFPLWFMV